MTETKTVSAGGFPVPAELLDDQMIDMHEWLSRSVYLATWSMTLGPEVFLTHFDVVADLELGGRVAAALDGEYQPREHYCYECGCDGVSWEWAPLI